MSRYRGTRSIAHLRSSLGAATFVPSHFGDASEAVPATTASTAQQYLDQYAPAISRVLFGEDARAEAAVLEAKIGNYRTLAEKTSFGPLRNFYVQEINKMEQRLVALRQRAYEQQAYSDRMQAGQYLGLGLLILAGVTMTAFAAKQVSEARLAAAQRRRVLRDER